MHTVGISVLLILYLVAIIYLGYRGYRQSSTQSDYLVAGRSTHPFVMAMSYGAAFISTAAIVGFGGVAGNFGLGLMWLPFMNIAIGILLAFLVFGVRTRRMGRSLNARTFPEFLGARYKSRRLKIFSALIIFGFMPLYSAVVLIGGARFLQETMGVPYHWALWGFAILVAAYVVMGGLKGVMYVDAFMGSIMVVGMMFLLVATYVRLGGVMPAHGELSAMAHLVPEKLRAIGHAGWTAMPEFGSQWWWILVSSLMLGVGIGALAQPQLAVRFMTVKSTCELNRAVPVGAVFILLTAGTAYLVGALSNVYFYRKSGQLAIEAAGGNQDLIIPTFINQAMPSWFVQVFALTLLSAAMSTLSSLFHVTGAAVGHDVYRNVFSRRSDSPWITRLGMIFGVAVSIVLALVLPSSIVARGTAIFFGVCAASFLPAYAAALYWKRATTSGVWASVAVGAAASLFGLFFLHGAESAKLGMCRALFGKDVLVEFFPWPYVDPLVYSLPLSFAVLIAVSLFTRKLNQAHLRRCFAK